MGRLPKSFYQSMDVIRLSKELIGKKLVSCFDGKKTSGIIVETEAYLGEIDRASHAYGLRRTARTEIMFQEGGVAYVYLCYGIHYLFNVVVSPKDIPHAILIRGIEPVEGIDRMLKRCHKARLDKTLTAGPGSLTRALGITTKETGISLIRNTPVWIEDSKNVIPPEEILSSTRIGVDYAKEDALLPYRFLLKGNLYVSRGKGK